MVQLSNRNARHLVVPALVRMNSGANPSRFLQTLQIVTDFGLLEWTTVSGSGNHAKLQATDSTGSLVITFVKTRSEYRSPLLLEVDCKDEDLFGLRSTKIVLDPATFTDSVNTLIWQKASQFFAVFHPLAAMTTLRKRLNLVG